MKGEDRLRKWKEFRQHIGTLPFEEAIAETVKLWSYAPFINHYLDQREVTEWPTPWELVYENKYDDLAKSAAMLYTLFLSEHGKIHTFTLNRLQISNLEMYNIVYIDNGQYILNYSFNEVISNVQIDKEAKLIKLYTIEDLQIYS
jgi:hypothetical protein